MSRLFLSRNIEDGNGRAGSSTCTSRRSSCSPRTHDSSAPPPGSGALEVFKVSAPAGGPLGIGLSSGHGGFVKVGMGAANDAAVRAREAELHRREAELMPQLAISAHDGRWQLPRVAEEDYLFRFGGGKRA